MKNFVTRLLPVLALLLTAGFSQIFAQGIQSTGFVIQVTSPSGTLQFAERDCEVLGTSGWAGALTEDICGELVWAQDITPDSLACDTIENDYTGKIVLIRRGACEFGRKTLWAQHAGAKAVIIVNHYNTATEDACTRINPGAGAVGAQVTIPPMAFGSRQVGELLDAAIKSGTTTACFVLPRVYEATAAYHYATPVSQRDTLDHLTIHYVNRTVDVQDNVVLKAEITEPSGNVVTLTAPLGSIAVSQDTLVTFPSYLPANEQGEFHVLFTNNKHSDSRDSMSRTFAQTEYTWSTSTFANDPQGYGLTNADFITNGFKFQCGGLALTGDAPGAQATHISFGISNIDSVFVPGATTENEIAVFLYDMDPNDVGDISYETTGWEDMLPQIVGFGTYQMVGNEQDGQIVSARLFDNFGNDFVELEPNHAYFSSILYDGTLAGYGRCIRFMNSLDEFYLNFPTELMAGISAGAPIMYNRLIGWKMMHRLQLAGYDPTGVKGPGALSDNKVSIQPNPSSDFVNVKLDLEAANKSVTVRLLDWTGKNVGYEIRKNFQNGQFTFDTQALPSGMYMFWISTDEGMSVKKVAVCH